MKRYFFQAGDTIVFPEALEVKFYKRDEQVYPELEASIEVPMVIPFLPMEADNEEQETS